MENETFLHCLVEGFSNWFEDEARLRDGRMTPHADARMIITQRNSEPTSASRKYGAPIMPAPKTNTHASSPVGRLHTRPRARTRLRQTNPISADARPGFEIR